MWSAIDSPTVHVKSTDTTYVSQEYCDSDTRPAWFTLQLVFMGVLMLIAVPLSFFVYWLPTLYSESRVHRTPPQLGFSHAHSLTTSTPPTTVHLCGSFGHYHSEHSHHHPLLRTRTDPRGELRSVVLRHLLRGLCAIGDSLLPQTLLGAIGTQTKGWRSRHRHRNGYRTQLRTERKQRPTRFPLGLSPPLSHSCSHPSHNTQHMYMYTMQM